MQSPSNVASSSIAAALVTSLDPNVALGLPIRRGVVIMTPPTVDSPTPVPLARLLQHQLLHRRGREGPQSPHPNAGSNPDV